MPGFQAHDNPDDVVVPDEVKIQPTEVLVKELLDRCHVGVIRLLRVRDGPDGQQIDIFKQWRGFTHEIIGCVEEMRIEIQSIVSDSALGGGDENPTTKDWGPP